MNDLFAAVVLGIVEGITEFLPISSTGHLIIVNQFIGFTGSFANMFDVVIQMGAILSVLVYYRRRLVPFGGLSLPEKQKCIALWKKTIVGVVPALFIGALAGNVVEEHLFNPIVVATALLVGGIVLVVIEKRKHSFTIHSTEQLSYRTALLIGLIQCLAMIPGTSRSAATIIGAMLLGASRIVAAEFSFFLAVPTLTAASAFSLLKNGIAYSTHQWLVLAIGFSVSFVVAWIVIAAFVGYISRKDFRSFGVYRVILGIIVLVYFKLLVSA
ncbi:MAG TPA: undecaprenyl-diphosphate phosphatase [bacterium]